MSISVQLASHDHAKFTTGNKAQVLYFEEATCEIEPVGTCPHSVCWTLHLDGTDTTNRDFVQLTSSGGSCILGFRKDGGNWLGYAYSVIDSVVIASSTLTADDPTLAHDFVVHVSLVLEGANIFATRIHWFVDGTMSEFFIPQNIGPIATLKAGAVAPSDVSGTGNAHRTVSLFRVLGKPGTTEVNENFTGPVSWGFFGSGASFTDSTHLRIDNTATPGGASADVTYNLNCGTCGCNTIKLNVVTSWTVSVTNSGCFIFSDGDTNTQEVCVDPYGWTIDARKSYPCGAGGGTCDSGRYFSSGGGYGVTIEMSLVKISGIYKLQRRAAWAFFCFDAAGCSGTEACGSSDSQSVMDLTFSGNIFHPDGVYTFSNSSVGSGGYTWDYSATMTITRIE